MWEALYTPVAWQGGKMVTSPKPGSDSQCDSYRGLTLTDHYGKAFMRLIIAAARPVLLRCAGGFQRASGA
eukprot:3860404-Prorocentrum_lima.AAC.1